MAAPSSLKPQACVNLIFMEVELIQSSSWQLSAPSQQCWQVDVGMLQHELRS